MTLEPLCRATHPPSQVGGSLSERISLYDGKTSGLIKKMEGNRVPVAFPTLQVADGTLPFKPQLGAVTDEVLPDSQQQK